MDERKSRENMRLDAFQKPSRPVKPPAVPPKSPSLYRTSRDPETPSSPTVSPKPFPRSPTLPRISPSPHYMAPQRSYSLGSPCTDDGSSVTRLPVPPRPVSPRPALCPPPVPPKTKNNVYLHPNVQPPSDTSDGGQAPSPVPLSSTESELRPTSPTALRPPASPSPQRRSPGPHRTQEQEPEVFPRSPTLPRSPTFPRSPSTPHYMSPLGSTPLSSPNIGYDSVQVERPVSPRPDYRPPPVPPKTKTNVYLHPNVQPPSDTSNSRRPPSPVSLSITESELRPTSPTALRPPASPSPQRRSPGPHRTQEQEAEEVGVVESSQRSRSPQPPTPAPRIRRLNYLTPEDCSAGSAEGTQRTPSATQHTPPEDTPLPVQLPTIHVTSQQPDEYDTPVLSDNPTSTCATIPPPVPQKTKTRVPQLTTTTNTEQYDRPTAPKPPSRPSYSNQHYQAPVGSLDDTNTPEARDHQAPHSAHPATEVYADRNVSYLSPSSPVPIHANSYMLGRSSPSAPLQRTAELKPELYASYQSVIYEATPAVLLPDSQAMEQQTAPRGGSVSPHTSRPPPPSFAPPPPPSSSLRNAPTFLRPMGSEPGYNRAYLQVLPDESGYQGNTHGPVRDSHCLSGTLSRSLSEPLLDKEEGEQEQSHLSKWKKTMELLDPTPFSRYRPMTAEEKTRWFNQTAQRVRKALTYFLSMLPGRRDTLRWHISELKGIADKLEKNKKRHRVMGTGAGTTGAVGGVAAVVGIALAPLTMGASLVATAVGAGMAVAAGGMGASSAVKKKKSKSVDQKRVEEIMRAYRDQVIDLEDSLAIVRIGMEELRRHDLTGASEEAVWMSRVAEAACRRGKADSVKLTLSSAADILKGFDAVSEVYYSASDSEKQRKGSENKFATKVSTAAQQLQEVLNDMTHAWETFSLATASV